MPYNFTNYSEIVELLLSYEASCNSADDKGSSPLHLAAWAGHAAIVEILLTRGPSIANVNLTVSISQYVEQKSNEHQKNMRNTITALKYVP